MLFITFQYFSAFMKKGKRYKEKNTQARNSPGKSTEVYYMLTSTLLRFKYWSNKIVRIQAFIKYKYKLYK